MAFFLSAQNAVSWQRRGIVTSGVQFFRTAGGSLGIGILGAIFNIITLPKLARLESSSITSATFLDPRLRVQLDPKILHAAGWMIDSGLHWVFISMLAVAVLQLFVSRWMPAHQKAVGLSKVEMAEAMVS
jgi:hypothetical protein